MYKNKLNDDTKSDYKTKCTICFVKNIVIKNIGKFLAKTHWPYMKTSSNKLKSVDIEKIFN